MAVVTNWLFIPFSLFNMNQKQESYFKEAGDLVTKNIFANFYKESFLHVIPIRLFLFLSSMPE